MAVNDDRAGAGEPESTGGPLIGRGSALRNAGDGVFVSDADPVEPPRAGRSVPRPPLGRSSRGRPWSRIEMQARRTRLALGVALVALLAGAWIWVGRSGSETGASHASPTTGSSARPRPAAALPADRVVAVPRWVPAAIAATCAARQSGATRVVVVECVPGRGVVALEYRGYASVAAERVAYREVAPRRGGAGPARCAQGIAEERSWSGARSPTVVKGRYRCSRVGGRARLVWTSEHTGGPATNAVLAVASRDDGDLRSLYEWWTTVPGPGGP